MFEPLNGMKFDESGSNRLVEVIVLYRVVVRVAYKYFLVSILVGNVLPLECVRAVRDHK
jgi:hypothetical protein